MAINRSSSNFDAPNLRSEVGDALSSADTTASERIQHLQSVHEARVSQLARTATALKTQYGADDPTVKGAEQAVVVAKAAVGRVAMVHRNVTTPEPQVPPDGWVLHGRAFDAQLAPVSGYTVFLVDSAKNYQRAYGFAYTDDTGYFLLRYAGTDTTGEAKSAPSIRGTANTGDAAEYTDAPAAELFIEVADNRAKPVYLSATAFHSVIGSATYQNIVLPAGGQPLGDLPAEIRKVAVPKREKVAVPKSNKVAVPKPKRKS